MLLTRFHSSLGPGAVAGTCKHAGPCMPRAMLQGRNVTPLPEKIRLCKAKDHSGPDLQGKRQDHLVPLLWAQQLPRKKHHKPKAMWKEHM